MHDPKSVCHIRKQGKVVFKCFQRKDNLSYQKGKTECKNFKRQVILNEFTENIRRSERERKLPAKLKHRGDSPNFLSHVGVLVNVLWTQKDLEGTNWVPGWYCGEVQRYDENGDQVFVLL